MITLIFFVKLSVYLYITITITVKHPVHRHFLIYNCFVRPSGTDLY